MRRKTFWIAAVCITAAAGLLPAFSSGAAPSAKEKVLYSFRGGTDGAYPWSDLTMDSAGNLYGTTSSGGSTTACSGQGCGTVFELKRTSSGWKEEILYSFTGSNSGGEFPQAGVIFDAAGNLYGTTLLGGTDCNYGCGTVFELKRTADGWKESTLYNFTGGNDGDEPAADLVFDTAGNLYGTTMVGGNEIGSAQCNRVGCGAVFELMPNQNGTWTEKTVYTFAGAPDGGTPVQGLTLDPAGNAYGVTETGGTGQCGGGYHFYQGCGALYKLTPQSGGTWTEAVIYSFYRGDATGFYPSGGLLLDKDGHLRGTTWDGGNGVGTIFDLHESKNVWEQRNPHLFYGDPDGRWPIGKLAQDAQGNLFGVTTSPQPGGGSCVELGGKSCIVFELEPNGDSHWTEKILHTFAGTDGDGFAPQAGPVLGPGGHLYGTTQYGGSDSCGCGTVYEITP